MGGLTKCDKFITSFDAGLDLDQLIVRCEYPDTASEVEELGLHHIFAMFTTNSVAEQAHLPVSLYIIIS